MRISEKVILALAFLIGAPALLWASGHVTATYFEATAATSTSTFAGSIAAETNGFVYDASTNRVGIGAASPAAPLHIYQNTNGASELLNENTNTGSGAYANIQLKTDGGSGYLYRTSNAYGYGLADDLVIQDTGFGDIVFYLTTDERMRITNGGAVGIGRSSPATALDVNGLIRVHQTSTTTCAASIEGSIFYHSAGKHFYGCDGTNWKQLDN